MINYDAVNSRLAYHFGKGMVKLVPSNDEEWEWNLRFHDAMEMSETNINAAKDIVAMFDSTATWGSIRECDEF